MYTYYIDIYIKITHIINLYIYYKFLLPNNIYN